MILLRKFIILKIKFSFYIYNIFSFLFFIIPHNIHVKCCWITLKMTQQGYF